MFEVGEMHFEAPAVSLEAAGDVFLAPVSCGDVGARFGELGEERAELGEELAELGEELAEVGCRAGCLG